MIEKQEEKDKAKQILHVPLTIVVLVTTIFLGLVGTVYALSIENLKETDTEVKSDIENLKTSDQQQIVGIGSMGRNIARLCQALKVDCEKP